MKRAFTLTELILMIIIVGIISVSASSLFKKDTLIPATNQLLDHIRYTQQLALNQDMFVPSPDFSAHANSTLKEKEAEQWFKKWWQIQFHTNNSYSIFSDHPTNSNNHEYDADADKDDFVAKDPLSGLYLYGDGASNSDYRNDERLGLVDLEDVYGVTVKMSGCSNSRHILFDNVGRPHCSKSAAGGGDISPYPYSKMKKSGEFIAVTLSLSDGSDSRTICITPITGYTYISNNNACP